MTNGTGQAGNPDLVVDDSIFATYTQGTGGVPGTREPGTFHVETDDTELYHFDSNNSRTPVGSGGAAFDPLVFALEATVAARRTYHRLHLLKVG